MNFARPSHGLWQINFDEVKNPDIEYVKAMMVKCFIEAQKETIARAKEKFGREVTEESVAKSIDALIRMTFKSQGADYDNPKKSDCEKVLAALYRKARAMGTPQDIADHHVAQLKKLVKMCPE